MKIIVNNLAVEYEDTGTGSVILLLHGWKDDLHTFDEVVPLLSSTFRIVRIDLPGFGGTELSRVAWSTEEYARFVKGFCGKLGIVPDAVVGHSFGGRVILKGTSEGILSPKKIVLIDSAGLAQYKTFHAKFFLFAAKAGKAALFFLPQRIQDRFRRRLYGAAGSGDYMNIHSGVLKKTFLKAIREDLSDCAREIHVPTLLICCDRDV